MKVAKNGLVLVEFVKSWRVYSRGQVAGFERDEARRLYKAGIVRPHGEKASAPDEGQGASPNPQNGGGGDGDDRIADLPEDWKTSVHWNTLRSIAADVTDDPIMSKDDAIAAIELEIERRKAAEAGQ